MRPVLARVRAVLAAIPLAPAFLALGIPTLALLAILTPLGEVADEPAHAVRAAGLADGRIVGRRGPFRHPDGTETVVTGMDVDPAFLQVMGRPAGGPGLSRAGWSTDRTFADLGTIGTYTPIFYAPAALGVGVARAMSVGPAGAALAGRLAGASIYLLIGFAALRLAVQGQAILFLVLAVPMSLSLAASFNHDGLIIATSALAAALTTRAVAAEGGGAGQGGRVLALATLCMAAVIVAKPPYFPLAAMLWMPLGRRSPDDGGPRPLTPRLALTALAILPAILWTAYALREVSAPVHRAAYEAGPLWPGARPAIFAGTDPAAQARVLLSNPIRLVTVPIRYLAATKRLKGLYEGAIGILGWLDVFLPSFLYGLWTAAFLGSLWVFVRPGRGAKPVARPWMATAVLTLAGLASLWGVLLSQYLTWTNVGEVAIQGPQGRYLLPIMPLLALLPARDGRVRVPESESGGWLPVLSAATGIVVLSGLLEARYGAG